MYDGFVSTSRVLVKYVHKLQMNGFHILQSISKLNYIGSVLLFKRNIKTKRLKMTFFYTVLLYYDAQHAHKLFVHIFLQCHSYVLRDPGLIILLQISEYSYFIVSF